LLHRAVSVFIFTSKGEWILQRRALQKYHSKGLWSNTCCSHPYPGETCLQAASRRLSEEMGLQCDLREIFSFMYKEQLDNGLTEHELDHVFIGNSDNLPVLNHHEVMDWRVVSYTDLEREMADNPAHFTVWFKRIYRKVNECLKEGNNVQ
jgi:isopentenyl-diphosphate delta-isomerase